MLSFVFIWNSEVWVYFMTPLLVLILCWLCFVLF
ncbi:hypothetical protein Pint_15197 [Pistacia integerrima]|uniref:Uncharacterized protein n=1 Tax=Pistacia integerrima TaxID=434235 RepID=A0ACC0ZCE1_9ROSI|nr:hypothetical protein Pint_15197 [Pistacia integerrima]